jgi:mono/diheme cytochrome c family protein
MVVDSTLRINALPEQMLLRAKWALRLSVGIFIVATAVSLTRQGHAQSTGVAAAQPAAAMPPGSIMWLDQGWTDQQRRIFHNQSQGTLSLPVPTSWFLAVQQPDLDASAGLFSDPAYLGRFGFIPGPVDPQFNPLGLPVGFAQTTGIDPRTGQRFDRLGFTCAACHTARLEYQQRTMLVDGGPAMIDLIGFGNKLALALGETDVSLTRFDRFARRVLGQGSNLAERIRLHRQLHQVVIQGLGALLQGPIGGVPEGFGRLDALNRIGNTVFADGMNIRGNAVATTAPVAYPHLWDVHWFSWVQYNASIERPMIRNAGEAMGVGASVNFEEQPTPAYSSTIPVDKLYDPIEVYLAGDHQPTSVGHFEGLTAPRWPETILPPINRALAARGADLYRARCQGCHLPAPNTPEFWGSDRWLAPNAAGERYLDLHLIPVDKIGTDPAQAQNMSARKVLIPIALGIPGEVGRRGSYGIYSYGPALGEVVQRVVDRWYDSQVPPTSAADRDRMNGFRANGIQKPLAYKARPLDGIWATAPYLHNGSVPTLWDLLSPYDERSRNPEIHYGNHEFDPVRVGYVDGGPSRLRTRLPGNRNTGHLFESPATPAQRRPGTIGPYLAPQDRMALIEYLKTL